MKAAAEAWYARQLDRLRRVHGTRWSFVEDWLKAYLREQIRQRAIERGWRPRR